ncbi:serine--tRNA ligase [Enterobacteriaceae endosymbiont of Macroplea mutica]|uniref:serine--tRNA ligase n=1 Tax=Enterobacteriaceae endosymbiont of Macroplea mutica TaxID=2675791 RepID=UPI00144A003A|nr:serine--tRNA ligase [Enterobacteriaceae endosymbiont of Macroplea mutica]QJC31439.1 serine--tRNA ligase [Enterobacteriaceae endosymbiont of Macroplea mutica]
MIDINLIRKNLHLVFTKLKTRNFILDIKTIQKYENIRKKLQNNINILYQKKKHMQNSINIQNKNHIQTKIKLLNIQLITTKKKLTNIMTYLDNIYDTIPNLPLDDVPIGVHYNDHKEILYWGKKLKHNFLIRNHIELGLLHNGIDMESGANLSGSKFIVMKESIAYLHRVLIQFMLDTHIQQHQYKEMYIPYIVKKEALYGTGQLPKFAKDLYAVYNMQLNTHYLIPTAEVPLTNFVANTILREEQLPIKLVAHSPCFRAEAGSYGQINKGLIRTHQFEKVELVQLVTPNMSIKTLEEITSHAEKILQLLELPYRKILLCSGDMSFAASKTYDLEVWLPSINKYCEVSSCSNMWDFQARRMKARYKNHEDNHINYIHTLNASALAIGRTLAAIIENYQLEDGSIQIPKVLQSYMKGLKIINYIK